MRGGSVGAGANSGIISPQSQRKRSTSKMRTWASALCTTCLLYRNQNQCLNKKIELERNVSTRNLHDAFPRRSKNDVCKSLSEKSGRLAATAPVLPLAQAAQMRQQRAQSDSVHFGQLLYKPQQLSGTVIVSGRTCATATITFKITL